jgi:hypothetical protein
MVKNHHVRDVLNGYTGKISPKDIVNIFTSWNFCGAEIAVKSADTFRDCLAS